MQKHRIFSISGKASRKEFWCYFILSFMITSGFLNVMVTSGFSNTISVMFSFTGLIIGCVSFYIGSAVSIRRLHDIKLSGYWSIILIGSWALNIFFSLFIGMPATIHSFKTIYSINALILFTFVMYLGCKKAKN